MRESELTIDARGHRCPVPTLKLRRAIEMAGAGCVLRLLADDPLARLDVPHFAQSAGLTVLEIVEDDGVLSFLIETPASQAPA